MVEAEVLSLCQDTHIRTTNHIPTALQLHVCLHGAPKQLSSCSVKLASSKQNPDFYFKDSLFRIDVEEQQFPIEKQYDSCIFDVREKLCALLKKHS